MINKIKISNYKCLNSVDLNFGKLNIVTGLNSVGKSSLIQAILDFSKAVEFYKNSRKSLLLENFHFNEIRNKYDNAREIEIEINESVFVLTEEEAKFKNEKFSEFFPIKNEGLYYLSANRIGPGDFYEYKKGASSIIGDRGEYIFSVFENKGNKPIAEELRKCEDDTLAGNVNFWLEEVLNFKIRLNSEVVNSSTLKINYKFGKLLGISPLHLGAGVSYVAQVIILCLLAKPGDIVIIENPEIHLHPAAQSKLGKFFAFVASKGVQMIIETHCEHLINRVCYEVGSEKTIENKQVKIFYKSETEKPFEEICLNSSGHYTDSSGNKISFPSGFFDSTLKELLELG